MPTENSPGYTAYTIDNDAAMEFVSISDIRTKPGEVWQQLHEQGNLVLTSSGRPFALMIDITNEDVEGLLLALRRTRVKLAVARLRRQAADCGLDQLSAEDIEAEVTQSRQVRRR